MSDRQSRPVPAALAPIAFDSTEDPSSSRRGALIRMLEIGVGIAGAAVLTSGASSNEAEARRAIAPDHVPQPQRSLVSLALVRTDGSSFPTFFDGGTTWIAGSEGERYDLHVQNHSNARVEIVVSVDGRDVISGKPGDFRKQRGYVLAAFGSLVIEGYRQSLDQIAAFRFSSLSDSYSARLGTPGNVGVIGVAAFAEKVREPRRSKRAIAPISTDPFPGEDAEFQAAPTTMPMIGDGRRDKKASRGPSDEARGEGWAAPEPGNRIGTEYGESKFSPVEEVEFKRDNKKKPEQVLVVRYDSIEGLQARGLVTEPSWRPEPEPIWHEPEPIRPRPRGDRDFAKPPPPRDWWR